MKQGIVMEIQTNDAYIFTNDCNMVKMPVQKDMFVGQSIEMPEAAVQVLPRRRWLVPALAAACVLLLFISGFLAYSFFAPQAGTVYLSIDINPSIEFTLDTDRKVVDVIPLNSDAWELLEKSSLIGLNYEEAIVKWVKLVREKRPEAFEDLLITAILDRRDRGFADQIMSLDSDQAARQLADLADLDIKVLFSTDPEIKKEADINKLSVGRQMLLNLAREKNIDIDIEEIRTGPLNILLDYLLTETGITTDTLATTAEPTTVETTSAPTLETTTAAATTTLPVETTKAPTPTLSPTPKPSTGLTLSAASNNASGWSLNWTISPSSKTLAYYKVVISQTDSTPKYPDNGYLQAISDRSQTSCAANNAKTYNGGDFGGYLTVGQKYYVSITYVFKDETKQYSNVLYLTYNGPARVEPAAFSPVLTGSEDASGFHISWTPSPGDRTLKYYKVVVSQTDSTPQHSENGYLEALGKETTSFLVNNDRAYNSGDFGGYLTVGQTYYVAITYVFSDIKITSNVLTMTYNGPSHDAPAAFEKVLSYAKGADSYQLNWSLAPDDPTFGGYKVVISETNPNPVYPADGYRDYLPDRASNAFTLNFSELTAGHTYYVAITYLIYEDKISSNVLTILQE